jgi:hypothetical protein
MNLDPLSRLFVCIFGLLAYAFGFGCLIYVNPWIAAGMFSILFAHNMEEKMKK